MKKAVALILVIFFLLTASTAAFAATESNAYITRYGALISSPSSGSVKVSFNVVGTDYMSSIGARTIVLYENGTPVKTFSMYNPAYAPNMYTTNDDIFIGYVTYPANSGSSYFAIVTVFASDGTGTGTETCSTNSITIP